MGLRRWVYRLTLYTQAWLASAALAGGVANYVPIPGAREFSGEMIARPVQETGPNVNELEAGRAAAVQTLLGGYVVREYVWQTDEYIFEVPAGRTENEVAAELLATGDFEYVEPNWILYPLDCPNDPRLTSQWQHNADRMQSCDGWDIHTGLPTTVVAICDTGVRGTHEDLQLHPVEGYNAVDRLWESQGGRINDLHGHGTATTGCAVANGDNGIGVSGVGWNLAHRMMRVSNQSNGASSLTVLQHAARTAIETGDRVASVSYSGVDSSSNLTTATYIKSIGGLLVWAAGNEGRELTLSDRDADDIIVVGATERGEALAGFSNFGRMVDLVAPGVDVYTTNAASDSSYGGATGTSFACPLTAGLAGLIYSASPALTPDEVEALLKAGVDDLGVAGADDTFGHGRINVFGSLSRAPVAIAFVYPNGLPDSVDPAGGTTLRVEVYARDLDPVPDTGLLHYNDGSGWVALPMRSISSNVYDAVFETTACGSDVAYYVSAEATDGRTYSDPGDAPTSAFTARSVAGIVTLAEFDFENAPGWFAESLGAISGDWQRGVPVNDPNWAYDPAADSDGSGQCWLTQNVLGNSDVDDGAVRVTSSSFDLSGGNVTIRYDYYLFLTNTTGGV
ncbi:MAG: S8 family serine peptidase, partial [Planctomycetes bacterium]|nr:S8 family serine peptidase [Planctomycetota bacterium]